jgi:PAS domain S-box-containing protein
MFSGQFIPQEFSPEQLKAIERLAEEINLDPGLLLEKARNMRVVKEDVVWNYSALLFQIVGVLAKLGAQKAGLSRAKDEVQTARNELEIRVQERTAELKQEITERKQAEKTVRKERDAAQRYLNISGVMFVVINSDRKVRLINKKGCEILEYREEDIIGKDWFSNFLPERVRDNTIRVFESLMAGDVEPVEYHENRVLTKSGNERVISWHNCILRDEEGRIQGTLGSGEDITERKQAEESLRKSESRFKSIAESMSDCIWEVDRDEVYIYCSNNVKDVLGYTCEEIIGKTPFDLMPSDERERVGTFFAEILKKNRPFRNLENWNLTKDGQLVCFLSSGTPMFDEKGAFAGYRGVDSDITARKQAEEEQKKTNQELEKAVELANQMAARAEAANIAKSEFLANMSHEIRTPMNAVIGFTDMLLDTNLEKNQIDYARTIRSSGNALLSVINDVLDFSKIEAGELYFEEIDFDPELLAYDICELTRPRIGSKPVEILCRIGDNLPSQVRGEPGRFRQVLINLMGNASKFTESGEIELSLDIEEEKDNQVKFHAAIRDTGIGIPKDKLSAIFSPFQQADGSTTRKYGGTGLGLSICKKISEIMRGDVWAKSPGPGSVFHFTAWLEKAEDKEAGRFTPVSLSNKKALIIDDNQTNLNILTHLLESACMRVVALRNGADVVPTLRNAFDSGDPFDSCIIDIQMPGMSGYDVVKQIRDPKSSIINHQSRVFPCLPCLL